MTDLDTEREARITVVAELCQKVKSIHLAMLRGETPSNLDGVIVRQLVRRLVEEWV